MKEKIILAFSGGLDTSFCAKYLAEKKNMDVHSVMVNTGAFSQEECKKIREKAFMLGVKDHQTIDISTTYYQKCIKYLVYGNILRNNTYPLSVSSERIFQAIAVVEHAKKERSKYIAHGCTGAGNDQIRFDMIFQIMAPEIKIITPVRDLKISRQDEINYLKKSGINMNWEETEYSINKGIWGTSIGGKETLSSNKTIPEHVFPTQLIKNDEDHLELFFNNGEVSGINNKMFKNPVDTIIMLDKIAGGYAIGRGTHVGDTIIGIKGRVAFEAAAPIIIIKAHHTLEKHVLSKWQLYWKEQIATWYGMMLHDGFYLDPVMRDMEKFLENSQQKVTGKVKVRLIPYQFEVCGIESEYDLMNSEYGSYGEIYKNWNADDIKGFTRIISNQMKIINQTNTRLSSNI